MFRLDNKTAMITGGGSGIGRAISILLAKQGANVYILDMDETGSQSVQKEIDDGGFSASFIRTDVSNQQQVNEVFSQVLEQTGRLDILVNNAGIAHIGNAENTKEEDFERLFRVNVKGVYNCLHAAVLHMKERGGAIINMASVAGLVGIPDRFAYSMTKGAVMGMTLSVAKDYLKFSIRCNSISPARVHTPFV